ncbi:MAG TPA: LytTR family DNA-binding domain-containing protein [Bryobacteraceae bacterium]|nr:LytTR family DNA-binding domain-containing protein [Bryobacteraceae bacterium]
MKLRAYIVDDEPLAVERLARLLKKTGRADLAGSSTNPVQALDCLRANPVDLLFLDIRMPGMSGFDLLAALPRQPVVIFTTAYDEYALRAFQVNSVDYLLKPIDPAHLERALDKAERMSSSDAGRILQRLEAVLRERAPGHPTRIAARLGDRVCFLELSRITHFYAEDKLTYAIVSGKPHSIGHTLTDLEQRLDPNRFLRISRGVLVNTVWVKEIAPGFAGGLLLRLNDANGTEFAVSRTRTRVVRERLGF